MTCVLPLGARGAAINAHLLGRTNVVISREPAQRARLREVLKSRSRRARLVTAWLCRVFRRVHPMPLLRTSARIEALTEAGHPAAASPLIVPHHRMIPR